MALLDDVRARLRPHSDVSLLFAGEDHVAGIAGPLLVVMARGEPGESIVDEAPRWIDRLLARNPEKGAFLVVVQASAKPPSDASRKRIERVYNSFARGVHAGAIAIEGKGFLAASIRSALSVLTLTVKYPYPHKTFATVTEAAPFLSGRLPTAHPYSPTQISTAVEDIRAAYEGQVGVFSTGG